MKNNNPAVNESILVVDDSKETLEILKRNLSSSGYIVYTSSSVTDAIRILGSTRIDLVVTDLRMPEIGGIHLVKHVRQNLKNTEVLVITGFPSVDTAIDAIKSGAEEYLTKPFTEEELLTAVRRTFAKLRNKQTVKARTPPGNKYGMVGDSLPIKHVYSLIEKIAPLDATILISGESGTGKELIARAVHYGSNRASTLFVPVNCAAIPNELLESELFGHVKGAFTGAGVTRAGFFQTADGGTIFLDEISNTSQLMQAKLLRALEEKQFYMVGDTKPITSDVRIIAATNVDLAQVVKQGLFREDLYHRLNIINIRVPPLRERGNDILLLTNHFTNKYAAELGKQSGLTYSDKVMEAFLKYTWPGNVRELKNLVYRLLATVESDYVDIPDLPAEMRFSISSPAFSVNKTLKQVESEYILNVLESVKNNKTKASEILDIDRKTLREKLKSIHSILK